jgi:hypothetical protein
MTLTVSYWIDLIGYSNVFAKAEPIWQERKVGVFRFLMCCRRPSFLRGTTRGLAKLILNRLCLIWLSKDLLFNFYIPCTVYCIQEKKSSVMGLSTNCFCSICLWIGVDLFLQSVQSASRSVCIDYRHGGRDREWRRLIHYTKRFF